jgi:ABC-type branched-subunit amino acid transport system ATPase component
VARAGYSLVVVDHRLDFLDSLTDRIVMMEGGRILSTGRLADHMANEEIAAAYLGAISSSRTRELKTAELSEADDGALPLLSIEHASIGYSGNQVLTDVSTSVPRGSLVAWLGPNGAGKTTLGAAVAGIVPMQSGTVRMGDLVLDHRSPWVRAWDGIAFVEASRVVFPRLTVRENLLAGYWAARKQRQRRGDRHLVEKLDLVYGIFPMLKTLEQRAAGEMSGGQQQMLVTARALMGSPKLAILDEPFAGLAPAVCDELGDALRQCVRELSMSIVLIDQDVARVCTITDRMLLLASGRVQLDGSTDELLQRPDLLQRFLGVAPDEEHDPVS